MGLFDSLGFAQPDPNNPFQQQAPSTTELILRLAQNLGPLAPYIGGHRTPLGRILGGGAALAGGVSGTAADLLQQQRVDPLAQQARLAAYLQQAGTTPTGTPSGSLAPFATQTNIPDAANMNYSPVTNGQPSGFPGVGAPGFDINHLSPAMQMVALKAFPKLDPSEALKDKQAEQSILQSKAATAHAEAQTADLINNPINRLVTNLPNQIAYNLARDPITGAVDYQKAADILKRLRTNPQGAEGQIFDYLARKNATGITDPGMEKTITDYQAVVRGTAINRAGGAETGKNTERNTPLAASAEKNVKTAGAGGTVTGKAEAEERVPLNEKASQWVNPTTLEYAAADMTADEAKKLGYATVTKQIGAAIPSARAALQTLSRYEELSKKLLISAGKGTAADIANIQRNRASLTARYYAGDPDVAEFVALSSSLPTQVKAMGDTGNIAIKEQEFQGRALPDYTKDSLDSALRKVESRKTLLQKIIRSSLTSPSRSAVAPLTAAPITPAAPTIKLSPAAQKYLDGLDK